MDERAARIKNFIHSSADRLAEDILTKQYALQPELCRRYTQAQRETCLQDIKYHLSYLVEAVANAQPSLFIEYVKWSKTLFTSLHIPVKELVVNLNCMREVLGIQLTLEDMPGIDEFIDLALQTLEQSPAQISSFISDDTALSRLARRYIDALLANDRHAAGEMVIEAVERGTSVKDIYLDIFQTSQYEIGRLWQTRQISIAQEHYCTAATQLIMSRLYPHVFSSQKKNKSLVAACAPGELHEIGVRMVSDFFEMEGWDTYYLGANTPVKSIIQFLAERKATLLALSATITPNVGKVAEIISAVRAAEAGKAAKIIVGGYPFKIAPELWRTVGADCSAVTAAEALTAAQQLPR
jgi:MerR family transcriptional regulator, light-induced transcriptional regulator